MPIDEEIQAIWTCDIRNRLSAVLLYSIPTGTCVQELMMTGKRQANMKPTIVISCGDAATKKRVEKTFRGQGWLQELLKMHHIMFVALVAETFFSAGPMFSADNAIKICDSYAVEQLPIGSRTSCGLSLLTNSRESGHFRRRSTLGGLLSVNGAIVGLTAGHPFDRMDHLSVLQRPPQVDPDAEDSSDERSSTISNEPFIFNGDEDDDTSGDDVSGDSDHQSSYQQVDASILRKPLVWYSPQATVLPESSLGYGRWDDGSQIDYDWALLERLPPAVRSQHNKVAYNDPQHDIQITGIFHGPATGKVVVATADVGPQGGYLHSAPATMKVDKFVLNVQLITLEHALLRKDLPWAYMVAIEPVLENIKQALKTGDVRLPTAAEIDSVAQAYDNQSGSLWTYEMDQQSFLTNIKWQPPVYEVLLQERGLSASQKMSEGPSGKHDGFNELNGFQIVPSSDMMERLPDIPPESHQNLPVEQSGDPVNHKEHPTAGQALGPENEKVTALHRKHVTSPAELSQPKRNGGFPYRAIGLRATDPITQVDEVPYPPRSTLVPSNLPSSHTSPGNSGGINDQRIVIGEEKKISQNPQAINTSLLQDETTMISPFNIWGRFEAFILRIEYGRRQFRQPYRLIRLFRVKWMLKYRRLIGHPELSYLDVFVGYFVTIFYFIGLFPFILWVRLRHGDVFTNNWERRRYRSISMLGTLPDYCQDDRLINERKRLQSVV
ncbi:MAG: hypothetical protein Q9218_003577 [Villophora microphyllina]